MRFEKYFRQYPDQLKKQIHDLIDSGNLRSYLLNKYPHPHQIKSDKLLYKYANELIDKYMRNVGQLNKVIYEKQKDLINDALGTHTFISRNHGGKLKKKHEMRISRTLKDAPREMLEMLVVHELAHFKEKDHNKAFYKLCEYMQPNYHQVEFDLRLYLVLLDQGEVLY
ncbi:PF01863 domain protein [Bacteriovorax sp. BAL6_X]|uniref:M48 metallopeptidase family protein n=1 Tax=Bacteriovorax sp. BAL6_X TaxID=1201290 RepID=UPI000386DF99|nr:YgjP-like metallopeptidase domain-containing protein [Bacteriovorax sp. BAL6_X]EPZ49531.1 PF01863 domain protein [Bacteriovorax sp. BAL6_X]